MPIIDGRQVATNLSDIRPDHTQRYMFAYNWLAKTYPGVKLKILDAGCGCGYGSFILSTNHRWTVTGVDEWAEGIEFAELNWSKYGAEFIQDNIINVAGTFDAVTAFEIIEHVNDALNLVTHLFSLAPIIICSVPNQSVLPFDSQRFPYHVRHYTPIEFEDLLLDGLARSAYPGLIEKYGQGNKSPGNVESVSPDACRTLVYVVNTATQGELDVSNTGFVIDA